MPFASRLTDQGLISALDAFRAANSFSDLYCGYSWRNDTHAKGFPDIYRLESRLAHSDRTTGISLDDVMAVAAWGAMRHQSRITGGIVITPQNTFRSAGGAPSEAIEENPLAPLAIIRSHLSGVGPTYGTKVLRFGLPQEYGAIDTRCVRVFGRGDIGAQQHDWIGLCARNEGCGWYIPSSQARWPTDFEIWIDILRYFAATLPNDCPHPNVFTQSGLRHQRRWTCADVEMALFSYASDHT